MSSEISVWESPADSYTLTRLTIFNHLTQFHNEGHDVHLFDENCLYGTTSFNNSLIRVAVHWKGCHSSPYCGSFLIHQASKSHEKKWKSLTEVLLLILPVPSGMLYTECFTDDKNLALGWRKMVPSLLVLTGPLIFQHLINQKINDFSFLALVLS